MSARRTGGGILLPSHPEPEYRAFELMDELPAGCIAHPVTDDRGWPHLRMGEFAVVDTGDTEPRSGDVYLLRWDNGSLDLVSIKRVPDRSLNPDPTGYVWWVGAPAYPWARPGSDPRGMRELMLLHARYGMNDGPYPGDLEYLRSKLVGRVVGILDAVTEGPMRLVA